MFERARAWIVKALSPVDQRGTWWPLIREPFAGAWQQNEQISAETALAYHAAYACTTLIASDIAKVRYRLVEKQPSGVRKEIERAAFSPVLRKPNAYQTHIQFKEFWILSKLSRGNTYVLKERDNRGVVARLYILDPTRVTVLVAESGDVFYQLRRDNLAGVQEEQITVPASEVIHDRMSCLFHPLVGISPLFASGLSIQQGLAIQRNQSKLFGNNAMPSGILTAPKTISNEVATRLRESWQTNYGGDNYGKVAVLGDDLKFQPMSMSAVDAQLIEQLKITAEIVCSTFHVPPFMVGIGAAPTYNNVESMHLSYYKQTLQKHIEDMEVVLDEGLGLDGRSIGVELDMDGLLRMDTAARYKAYSDAISGGWMAPNEARLKEDLEPVEGGDSPLMQQQNWSLAQLARRDIIADAPSVAAPQPSDEPDTEADEEEAEARALLAAYLLDKELRNVQYA